MYVSFKARFSLLTTVIIIINLSNINCKVNLHSLSVGNTVS